MRGATLALAAALAGGCREREVGIDARVATLDKPAAQSRILYPSAPGSFVDVVANARHGVVAIRAKTPVKSGPAAMFPGAPEAAADPAVGTGFLIEAKGVFVVTTDHIAAASPELEVVLPDGAIAAAKVLGRDPRLDLALLAVDVPRLQPLPLGNSDEVHVGEWLVVLGDPFGDEVTASAGIVSATGRTTSGSIVAGTALGFRTYLQTDARIHRGNAGGPVLDTAGQVVGVAIATGDRPGELSFAIPINRVKEIVDALRDRGVVQRGWLGVLVKPVPAELAATLGGGGALVTELKAGSPAARAGLRAGDVIVSWSGRAVDQGSLPWLVAAAPVGKPIEVVILRNGQRQTLPLVTEPMPE